MKKKIFLSLAAVLVIVFLISSVIMIKNNKGRVSTTEGNYKTVHEVEGVSFSINTSILNKATAISEISEKAGIDSENIYMYKDGGTNYLLFGFNSIVIAVEKGTTFPFYKEFNEEDIYTSDVAGLWFDTNTVKFKPVIDDNSITCEVTGGLNISTQMYCDYTGKLKIISDGTNQWSIFVGVPGLTKFNNLEDSSKDGISAIAESLTFSNYVKDYAEETYAISIGGEADVTQDEEIVSNEDTIEINAVSGEDEEDKDTEEVSESVNEDADSNEDTSIEEVSEEKEDDESDADTEDTEDIEVSEEDSEPDEEEKEEEAEDEASEDVEVSEESAEEAEPEAEPEVEEDKTPSPTPETTPTPSPNNFLNISNQKITSKKKGEAYSSDIYSMLSLGDNGIIEEYDIESGVTEKPIITVTRVYKGKTAVDMITSFCSETGQYNYFNPPVGCEWHVAEYSLIYTNCNKRPYINIKLKGIDGSFLRYKGIKYSRRTYDMFNKAKDTGNVYGKCYAYYAVPYGCHEYVLECGTGNIDIEQSPSKAAYYLVKY